MSEAAQGSGQERVAAAAGGLKAPRAASLLALERETYLLGLVRVAFGAMLLRHVFRLASELRRTGYFGDRFHMPLLPESWVPERGMYTLWLAAMALATVCAIVGVRAREGLLFSSSSGLYVLLCDRLQYHNNRYSLLLFGFLLAFTPCDRSFALRRAAGAGALGPRWAVYLMQLQVSLIYASSALGKLVDPDWRGGLVLLLRAARSLELATERGIHLPAPLVELAGSPLAFSAISKLAIGTELFLALGLWLPRSRPIALWLGVLFHLGIELSARVELFSYVMWTSYVLFAVPELRERGFLYRADDPSARRLARWVRALDWLARFRIEPLPAQSAAGPRVFVQDRSGQPASGLHGFTLLARAIPLLFPLWLPLRIWLALPRSPRAEHARA
jgi:hypothetical protein